ncbi:hypothetical protein ZWY2020_017101, partial [Hordeum vulgare]
PTFVGHHNPSVVFEDATRHGRDEMLLRNHQFFYDEMQNAAEQEKHDAIDLNDPPGMDSDEDTLQQLTDGATNHNGQVGGNDANGNATTLVDEPDEDILSQPIVPFVGMLIDNVEEAQRVYNEYALKIGFGTRIVTSRHSRTRASEKKGILRFLSAYTPGKIHQRMPMAAFLTVLQQIIAMMLT